MDIRRQLVGLIEAADTDEFDQRTSGGIVTPERDPAVLATRD